MGKLKTLGDRGFNTVVTPLRYGGEIGNGLGNVLRQGQVGVRNSSEVSRQTLDALVNNFLNRGNVKGKRYQRMVKIPVNLVSAFTRRPLMIAGNGLWKTLQKGVIMPGRRVITTPRYTGKGIFKATSKIFSKKRDFDRQPYKTDNVGNIWVTDNKNRGLLGVDGGTISEGSKENTIEEKLKEEKPKEEKTDKKGWRARRKEKRENKKAEKKAKLEEKRILNTPRQEPKNEDKPKEIKEEKQTETPKEEKTPEAPKEEKPKSIDQVNESRKEENKKRDNKEKKNREDLNEFERKRYQKDFESMLSNDLTPEGVIARGKKNEKGNTIEEITGNLEKDYNTFATYIKAEIIDKQQPAKAA